MSRSAVDSLALSRTFIRVLIRLNQALGLGITVMLISSLVAEDFVFRALGVKSVVDAPLKVASMRMIMVFGILSVPLAHLILTRLLAVVESVPLGPFISANADRMRQMGWGLLGLEALHLAVGAAAAIGSWGGERIPINWAFSATRWLAVLLLFVLARVFEQGTRMREDLEGTV
jgi:hypothetical protein